MLERLYWMGVAVLIHIDRAGKTYDNTRELCNVINFHSSKDYCRQTQQVFEIDQTQHGDNIVAS